MTTQAHSPHTFSDGQRLTGWLERVGAPKLPDGHTYRVLLQPQVTDAQYSPSKVTVFIYDGDTTIAQATEVTRVSSDMAAVAAARHAFEQAF